MSIVTTLILITLGLAVGSVVIIFQVVALARIYRSRAWMALGASFIALGGRQLFGLIQLPSAILEAQLRGTMIERLTLTQWISVAWAYVIIAGFIFSLDWLRRDLRKIGI